ncbi:MULTISPECIES: nuclease-related domain-containing protein [unclassified Paraflavitalea]|uniref:nuclease-related domain-containing protein n=1 Tax=unclassified Paraflavitalea TaxID=2798305 RepID=UPI003D330DE8
MCKVHNQVGCLTVVKSHLHKHGIKNFHSINELIEFQKNLASLKREVFLAHEQLIQQEHSALTAELPELEKHINEERTKLRAYFQNEIEEVQERINSLTDSTQSNFFKKFFSKIKLNKLRKSAQELELSMDSKIEASLYELNHLYSEKAQQHQYLSSNTNAAISDSSYQEMMALEYKNSRIEEVKNSIYGAIGEHKVVKVLEGLSDEYTLINDFSITFARPIYNRQENDYIKSIQIDHLLISPAGIFLIETKNWSEKSLASLDLRSPVEQVKRTNFALYKIMNEASSNGRLNIGHHHWGDRKIPIKNIIVLTGAKPNMEFQHVKILSLNELVSYVSYFKPLFSEVEVDRVSKFMLNLLN